MDPSPSDAPTGCAHQHPRRGEGLRPEEARRREYKPSGKKIPRVRNHHRDWLEAIRTGRQAGANFDYGGPLTELALLGAIAVRFPGQELKWDARSRRFSNFCDANAYVNPGYREGWKL